MKAVGVVSRNLAMNLLFTTEREASREAKIIGHEKVTVNTESALLKAVGNQAVLVYIDASGAAFQFYLSRIFIGDCGTKLDNRVDAVGYMEQVIMEPSIG